MRAELVARVHHCNVWVRACSHNVGVIMEEHYTGTLGDGYSDYCSDCDDCCCDCGGGDGGSRVEPSKEWLAACPALAWASMRIAAYGRPSLAVLLGRKQ